MEITSLTFAVLVIISIFIFYLIPAKYRITYLVLLSCLFIASYSLVLMIYTIGYTLINFYLGLQIYKRRSQSNKSLYLTGIVFNLLQLALLKYHTFLFNPVFNLFHFDCNISKLSEIIIPLGISFFTLQGIGYLINVYKGWEKPEINVPHFALYIIFFPKFLSGPIERSNRFLPQLRGNFLFDQVQVSEGLRIALIGYFKKIVIANQLGLIVNNAYTNIDSFSGLSLWFVLIIQPFYLYFDFSGYTDIAIGFAKAFGIKLSPNFERPFFAENISSFWRRWHMSLTSWFNDYVFRQVSFNCRKWGIFASVFAVFVTFMLFGIWHGAGWQFMILGFIQAIAINYEYFTKKNRIKLFSKIPNIYRIWISRTITFCFFCTSLVFFFSTDIKASFIFYNQLFNFHNKIQIDVSNWNLLITIVFILAFYSVELLNIDNKTTFFKLKDFWIKNRWLRLIIYFIMIILVLRYLSSNEAFIYQMF